MRKYKITNIGNERGITTADLMDIKSIIKKYYEKLYAHKFDNLDEVEKHISDKGLVSKIHKELKMQK